MAGPPARRPPPQGSFPQKVVEACGGFWDIFPWIGVVAYIGLSWARFGHPPAILAIVALVVYLLWFPLYVFWLVCDVVANGAAWYWILICLFCCYPFSLIYYLMTQR